jgi:hypothetical protein
MNYGLINRFIFAFALVFSARAFAYYSVMDNGEILAPGKYKITGETQFITDDGGINIPLRFDAGLNDEMGIRGIIGFGATDFFAGGMFKWMPVPDLDNQPAIGANMGILYGRDRGSGELTFRFEPLISKRFEVNFGHITPYASIPLGVRTRNGDRYENDPTDFVAQFAVGGQLELHDWNNLQFMTELGVDLDNAYSYLSFAAVIYFDEEGFDLPGSNANK